MIPFKTGVYSNLLIFIYILHIYLYDFYKLVTNFTYYFINRYSEFSSTSNEYLKQILNYYLRRKKNSYIVFLNLLKSLFYKYMEGEILTSDLGAVEIQWLVR